MASYYELVSEVARWMQHSGIEKEQAAAYTTTMLHALSATTLNQNYESLLTMSEECLTPGGLNEHVVNELRRQEWFGEIQSPLNEVLKRIQ